MANVPNAVEILPKIATTSVTDDRRQTDRQTDEQTGDSISITRTHQEMR